MATNNLFVFGNGFDLAHGLPTQYMDFLNFIEGIKMCNQSTPASYLMDICPGMKKEMAEYLSDQKNGGNCKPYIQTIQTVLHLGSKQEQNPWHQYFLKELASDGGGRTWIDFETAIKDMTTQLDAIKVDTDYLQRVREYIQAYWYRFPDNLERMAESVNEGGLIHFSQARQLKQETAMLLYRELLRYTFCFELYLRFYVMAQEPSDYLLSYIRGIFRDNVDRQYYEHNFILSFNYTDIEKRYTSEEELYSRTKRTVQHIHGSVRSQEVLEANMDDPEFQMDTPLILGYNNPRDEQDEDGSPYLRFEKFYQRILHKTGTSIYRWLDNKRGTLKTVFYGHSLDVSDADLIRRIFNASTEVEIWSRDETGIPKLLTNLTRSLGKKKLETAYIDGKIKFRCVSPKE